MKKLFSSIMLFAACALPMAAQTITVTYNGDAATVNIPEDAAGVTSTVNGAYVTLTSTTTTDEYTYKVSGATTNGGLTINGVYKLTLELAGTSITSQKGAAIDVECGKRIAVVLDEGTDNTLADYASGSQKAAMYFSGHPEFSGAGTLNVTGNCKHAICAKEYLQLKKSLGSINILGAVSDGIHCGKGKTAGDENEYFLMGGGIVTMENIQSDCIDANDLGSVTISGGTLNLNVTATDVKGIKCVNEFTMDGGTININVTGDESDGIYCSNKAVFNGGTVEIYVPADGSKGIKGKMKYGTGDVTFAGTDVNITAVGDDVVTIVDGVVADTTHCVAISVDGNLTQTAGDIEVLAAGNARGVTCDGTLTGTINVKTQMAYVHPYDYEYDMTMYGSVIINDEAVTDYSDYEIYAYVGDECRGVFEPQTSTYGYMRIYSNKASGETINFNLYKKSEEKFLTSTTTATFASSSSLGTPSAPKAIEVTDKATAISKVTTSAADSEAYAISGVRVANAAAKGIMIKGGKKFAK